jgi:hypothetical protein
MNQSQSYRGTAGERWLSQLLADLASPLLVLAVAVSQVKIGLHKKDALRECGRQSAKFRLSISFGKAPANLTRVLPGKARGPTRKLGLKKNHLTESSRLWRSPLPLELFPISHPYRCMVRMGQPSSRVEPPRRPSVRATLNILPMCHIPKVQYTKQT